VRCENVSLATYLCDCDAAIKLDEVVKVAKNDGNRDEFDVARIAQKMRDQLDSPRKDPMGDEQAPEQLALLLILAEDAARIKLVVQASFCQCKVEKRREDTIDSKGPLCNGSLEDGV
jgi:hypothetical protein